MDEQLCGCGRSYGSLNRESDHIRETVGPRAADDFDYRHYQHMPGDDDEIVIPESEARALAGDR